jgi:hypothetical protein
MIEGLGVNDGEVVHWAVAEQAGVVETHNRQLPEDPVNVHKNARLTPAGRALAVQRVRRSATDVKMPRAITSLDLREPELDLLEPRAVGRREVEVYAGCAASQALIAGVLWAERLAKMTWRSPAGPYSMTSEEVGTAMLRRRHPGHPTGGTRIDHPISFRVACRVGRVLR